MIFQQNRYGFMTDYHPNCELNLAMQKNMTVGNIYF